MFVHSTKTTSEIIVIFSIQMLYRFSTTNGFLVYSGINWIESEHAAIQKSMLHTDVQLKETKRRVDDLFCEMEKLGIPRAVASAGGKKFRDSLNDEQKAAYLKFLSAEQYNNFVLKYRNTINVDS